MAKTPKTHEDLSGTKTGSYEEALASRRIREGFDDSAPRADVPTGSAVYVNPALNDGPSRAPVPETVSVPVINDPGILGANRPTLAELNAANRGVTFPRAVIPTTDSEPMPDLDPTSGITEDSHREEIRAAAQDRQAAIVEGTADSVKKAEDDAKAAAAARDAAKAAEPPKN